MLTSRWHLKLGLNPKKFGKLANHRQEPWKLPLPHFIAKLYTKRFGKAAPTTVRTTNRWQPHRRQKNRRKKCEIRQPWRTAQPIPQFESGLAARQNTDALTEILAEQ